MAAGLACASLAGTSLWQAPDAAATLKSPIPVDEAGIAQGKKTYLDRCADCHGMKGKGDGPAAADLDPKPGDLSKAAMNEQSDGALFWKVTEGRKPMPTYRGKLTEEQRWQVVSYIRTLAPKK